VTKFKVGDRVRIVIDGKPPIKGTLGDFRESPAPGVWVVSTAEGFGWYASEEQLELIQRGRPFRAGDKVRVLHRTGFTDSVSGAPFDSVIVNRAEGGYGWMVADPSGRGKWHVLDMHLELIEDPAPAFTPYEGWEEDVRLLAFVGSSREGTAAGDAAKRLLAAFPAPKSPNCGKALQHDYGEGASSMVTLQLPTSFVFLTCTLPANHDGPHVPDVPDEAWR